MSYYMKSKVLVSDNTFNERIPFVDLLICLISFTDKNIYSVVRFVPTLRSLFSLVTLFRIQSGSNYNSLLKIWSHVLFVWFESYLVIKVSQLPCI